MSERYEKSKRKKIKWDLIGIIAPVSLLLALFFCTAIQVSAQALPTDIDELRTGNSSFGNQLVDYYGTFLKVDMGIELAQTIEKGEDNEGTIVIKKIKGIDIFMSAERSLGFLIQNQSQIAKKKELDISSDKLLYLSATIKYDQTKVAGNRVESIQINKKEINKDKYYTVAMSKVLSTSEDYPEIRDSKEQKKSGLLIKDAVKTVLTQQVTSNKENSRYELKKVVIKKSSPNILLMVLSSVLTIGLGVFVGWIYGKNKQKN